MRHTRLVLYPHAAQRWHDHRIGGMAVCLVRMAPYALPAPLLMVILSRMFIALLAWRTSTIGLMGAGAPVGVVRSRLWPLRVHWAAL